VLLPRPAFARWPPQEARRDRLADVLLIAAAGGWQEVGSGSFSALWAHVAQQGMSACLQAARCAWRWR
jgi:NAD(P)H-quinone oxidoreductase subunit 5